MEKELLHALETLKWVDLLRRKLETVYSAKWLGNWCCIYTVLHCFSSYRTTRTARTCIFRASWTRRGKLAFEYIVYRWSSFGYWRVGWLRIVTPSESTVKCDPTFPVQAVGPEPTLQESDEEEDLKDRLQALRSWSLTILNSQTGTVYQ